MEGQPGIRPTASDESLSGLAEAPHLPEDISNQLIKHFSLGWSHYVALLSIDNADECRFYEIEAEVNQWSVRELDRQIDSSLYERLALSRDKEEIRRLARQGQVVEKAADLIKSPMVLEFLGLEEKPAYSENDLESAIIDKLESFQKRQVLQCHMFYSLRLCSVGEKSTPRSGKPSTSARNRRNRTSR